MSERSRPAGHFPTAARGLLALDQPLAHTIEMLRATKVPQHPGNVRAFRDLVLSTPGLERIVGGLLVDAATLHAGPGPGTGTGPGAGGRGAVVPAVLAERRVPIGVRMGDETVHALDVPGSVDGLAADVARHAAAGASFARWRIVVGEAAAPQGVRAAAGLVAQWAACCQAGGLVPFVDLVVLVPARYRLADAARHHRAAVAGVLDALEAADADLAGTLLGSSLVVPGRRSSEAATADDIARATVGSLGAAGTGGIGGVVFTPTGRAGRLTAHLAAMQQLHPEWPVGFCLGRSLLTSVARVWRGRAENVADAQAELHNRLNCAHAALRAGLIEARAAAG